MDGTPGTYLGLERLGQPVAALGGSGSEVSKPVVLFGYLADVKSGTPCRRGKNPYR